MRRLFSIAATTLCLAGARETSAASKNVTLSSLGIPESVASVVEASGDHPQWILIQDIHRHPEAQNNISAMVLYGLRHWDTKEIFVEGSWESGDALKGASRDVPLLVEAVRDGRLGGAEMAAAMAQDVDFRLLGLEDEDTYRKNVEAYQAVERDRKDALRELETTRLFGRAFDQDLTPSLAMLQRLIQLKLKPAEYAEYLKNPYRPTSASRLASAVASAERFYEIANERSRIFLAKAKALHQSGPQVLIVGGFHTTAMAQELRQEGVSFVVLSPHVTQGGFDDLYSRGMHDTISALKMR